MTKGDLYYLEEIQISFLAQTFSPDEEESMLTWLETHGARLGDVFAELDNEYPDLRIVWESKPELILTTLTERLQDTLL